MTKEKQYVMEDLVYYWMDDGLPCFVADIENICDVVESFDFSIYYLLATEEKVVTPTTSTTSTATYNKSSTPPPPPPAPKKTASLKLFKVVNNFVGRSISIVDNISTPEIVPIEPEAIYNMPAIPNAIITKLDEFFRLVDAQHGTESIVLLGYDTEKEDSDGWCVLVPDQTNTSVHCNYDPHSIAEIKPDNVVIVGSVHSHPGMSAYASGTDHADQADFDGVHITFGWQKSVNNGATQYYIEMQMAGKSYKLDPEDVFEGYTIDKAPDPEVVGWTDKVKKVNPPSTGGMGLTPTDHTAPRPLTTHTQTGNDLDYTDSILGTHYTKLINIDEFNISMDSMLIQEIQDDTRRNEKITCSVCQNPINDDDIYHGYCRFCDIPIASQNEEVTLILANAHKYLTTRAMDTNVEVHLWCKDGTSEYLIRLQTDLSKFYSSEFAPDINPVDWEYSTLCCSEPLSTAYMTCNCKITAVLSDFHDMVCAFASREIYDYNSDCPNCVNYFSANCPSLRELTLDYVAVNKNIEEITWFIPYSEIGCSEFTLSSALDAKQKSYDRLNDIDDDYHQSFPIYSNYAHYDDESYWSN